MEEAQRLLDDEAVEVVALGRSGLHCGSFIVWRSCHAGVAHAHVRLAGDSVAGGWRRLPSFPTESLCPQ
eukprot:2057855-Alexandrium_andersonii.AAC.1